MDQLLTKEQLAESLIFFRRNLTERIALELVKKGQMSFDHIAQNSEDLANAISERLEARETGVVSGYHPKARK